MCIRDRFDSFKHEHQAVLRAELSYPVSLGDDARGNSTRLDNPIDNFADRNADGENALQNPEQQKQAAKVEVAKPFAQEEDCLLYTSIVFTGAGAVKKLVVLLHQ